MPVEGLFLPSASTQAQITMKEIRRKKQQHKRLYIKKETHETWMRLKRSCGLVVSQRLKFINLLSCTCTAYTIKGTSSILREMSAMKL